MPLSLPRSQQVLGDRRRRGQFRQQIWDDYDSRVEEEGERGERGRREREREAIFSNSHPIAGGDGRTTRRSEEKKPR